MYKNSDNKLSDKGLNPELTSINKKVNITKKSEYKYLFFKQI